MPLPDVRIEPWEYLAIGSNVLPVAPASARLLVQETSYLVRVAQDNSGRDLLVVRPEREGGQNSFISELYDSVGRRFLKSLHSDPTLAADKLQILLYKQRRIIFLDEKSHLLRKGDGDWCYCLTLSRGFVFWESEEMGIHSNWALANGAFEQLLELDANEVMEQVWQWTKERSDCAFAFEWVSQGWNWPARRLLSLERGIPEEIENLVQWATWSDTTLADSEVWWVLNVKSRRPDEAKRETGIIEVKLHIDSNDATLPVVWGEIWKHLQNYFDMRIDQKLIDQYPYTEGELVGGEVNWWLTIPPASGHERLEARLKWRDWVQMHVPQAQWRTLLPDDEVVE